MTFDDIKKEMAEVEGKVSALTKAKIRAILRIAEKYRWLGREFTFSATDIDARVDAMLDELAKTAYMLAEEGMEHALKATDEEDSRDTIFMYARSRNADTDKYTRRLKAVLEGWLAIAFAGGINQGKLLAAIMTYMDNPYISPYWRSAIKDGRFKPDIIKAGGYRYGKGSPYSPVKGMTLIITSLINTTFQYASVDSFRRMGAIGYRVLRTTTYDCPICDELCVGIHPLSEVVLPAHIHCACRTEPVFLTDL